MATILCPLATIISCPSKFQHTFAQFPSFRVIRNSDGTLTFEDPKTGEWFINTTRVESLSNSNGIISAVTRNSVYSFAPVVTVTTPSKVTNKTVLYKVSFVGYELSDDRPDWTDICSQMADGTWVTKTYCNSFFKIQQEAEEHANDLVHYYDDIDTEEVTIAKGLGCCKLNGVFRCEFDNDFIEAVERWRKRIYSHGEFAFNVRRAERKEMRETLAPATLDKIERRNRLDYMREFA